MPEAVKISELPVMSTVQAGDILPVVDSQLTQTGRATAAQVAAIGGGPPGDNTVSTAKMQDNAVTAAKCSFTAPDKLFSRTAAGAGSGVEIACTPYARGLLAVSDGAGARGYLDALQTTNNPIFTGQVQVSVGSAEAPSIVPSSDLGTGIFFPQPDALSVANNGVEIFRLSEAGIISIRADGETVLRPSFRCVAWANLNGFSGAGTSTTIGPSAEIVAARYGLVGTIIGGPPSNPEWTNTLTYLESVEQARGLELSLPTGTFTDSKGKGTFPRYNMGSSVRGNFTSVNAGNWHWFWNGSAWQKRFNVYTIPWLGMITLTSSGSGSFLRDSRGIAAVEFVSTGTYRLIFSQPMPDTNYSVVCNCSQNGTSNAGTVSVVQLTTGHCTVTTQQSNTLAAFNPLTVTVAVFR